ncbi:hypothetical protein FA95DRAFT_1219287 [Auriscalpium vulgare]|uniref:Uncharacterized protein n=1 Tax=Auriscalpium vulgare TaxID=40419 RepID=A0ACB8RUG9_9AGAM|nr:hypothetical protein FA95DRAFT_1219287 [Auriscalpium vulgare]
MHSSFILSVLTALVLASPALPSVAIPLLSRLGRYCSTTTSTRKHLRASRASKLVKYCSITTSTRRHRLKLKLRHEAAIRYSPTTCMWRHPTEKNLDARRGGLGNYPSGTDIHICMAGIRQVFIVPSTILLAS